MTMRFRKKAVLTAVAMTSAVSAEARFLQTDPVGYKDQVNLYAYVENDPMNKIDPDGQRIKLVGTPEYRRDVLRQIRQNQSGPNGRELVRVLIRSPNEIVVRTRADAEPSLRSLGNLTQTTDREAASNGRGTGSTVYFDSTTTGGVDVNGSNQRPSHVGLAHEFGHSETFNAGNAPVDAPRRTGAGTTPAMERNAVTRENQVRQEHGVPARTTYFPPASCKPEPGGCR